MRCTGLVVDGKSLGIDGEISLDPGRMSLTEGADSAGLNFATPQGGFIKLDSTPRLSHQDCFSIQFHCDNRSYSYEVAVYDAMQNKIILAQ